MDHHSRENRTREQRDGREDHSQEARGNDPEQRDVKQPENSSDDEREGRRSELAPQPVEERPSEADFLADSRKDTEEKEQLPHRNVAGKNRPAELFERSFGHRDENIGEPEHPDSHNVT